MILTTLVSTYPGLLCALVESLVASQLLARRQASVELDLLHPLLLRKYECRENRGELHKSNFQLVANPHLLFLAVGAEQELASVGSVESEDEIPLGVVVGKLDTGLVDHDGAAGGLGLEEVLLVPEEAHELAAENCVVALPRPAEEQVVKFIGPFPESCT